jgi:hypothetical protein
MHFFLFFVFTNLQLLLLLFEFIIMGGGRQYPYPKWVWSPAGGWWPHQPNGTRNSIIYAVVSLGIMGLCASYAESKTVF